MTPPISHASASEIRAAHTLIRDLFTPAPWHYWRELLLTGPTAWAAFLFAASGEGSLLLTVVLTCVAALFWYRAIVMIHELTHQNREKIPGIHLAWNWIVGHPWMVPSVLYEGVHLDHHRRASYGTAVDPEYLPLAGRPVAIFYYLGLSFLICPIAFLRFLVAAPVSWFVPRLRRFLVRSVSSYVINPSYVRVMSTEDRQRLFQSECAILLLWLPPVALTLVGELPWRWLVCWYGAYTLALFLNRLRMLSAHHFASGSQPTDHLGQFRDSSDHPGGWWAEVWAPLGLRYHALHHLFPTIPFHNLGPAYQRLTAQLPAASFYHQSRGTGLLRSVLGLVRGSSSAALGHHQEGAESNPS